MTVLVFDLDDTLYDEHTYVESGFRAVAAELSRRLGRSEADILERLLNIERTQGRGRVFDTVLKELGAYDKRRVKRCLFLYRNHTPQISLWEAADQALIRFANLPIYVVTDGNKHVQRRKMKVLGLYERCRRCIPSWAYGRQSGKPSPLLFQRICQWESVSPHEVVYIGDNPTKDFVGIRPLGFQTVRVKTGQHQSLRLDPSYEADATISTLNELTPSLLNRLNRE